MSISSEKCCCERTMQPRHPFDDVSLFLRNIQFSSKHFNYYLHLHRPYSSQSRIHCCPDRFVPDKCHARLRFLPAKPNRWTVDHLQLTNKTENDKHVRITNECQHWKNHNTNELIIIANCTFTVIEYLIENHVNIRHVLSCCVCLSLTYRKQICPQMSHIILSITLGH